ncbi:MAG: hypothetical protein WC740_07675 [Verrucomicrobiia bacterium]
MMKRKLLKGMGYGLAVLLVSAGLFFAIALFPGSIEGVYRGMAFQCACYSVNFMYCTNGKLIHYSSEHPPAEYLGRYEVGKDGSCSLYLFSAWEGASETPLWRAYPHFLVTRLVDAGKGGQTIWCWKWPRIGLIGKTIREQEIARKTIIGKGRVAATYFDSNFRQLRQEIITRQDATKAEPVVGDNASSTGTHKK